MKRPFRFIQFTALAVMLAMACNVPIGTSSSPGNPSTQAALTVEFLLTSQAPLATPTLSSASMSPISPPISSSATPVIITPTSNCDMADFVTDVTYPDNSIVAPGAAFVKTWRIKNVGTCAWDTSYTIMFLDGNSMNGPSVAALPNNVNPGQTVDISVSLTAPTTPGIYQGNYRLRNAAGKQFAKFYVQIKVDKTSSSGYDLYTRAEQAEWKSGAGTLVFGGPDTDAKGFVMYPTATQLEDGSKSAKVLEMYPQWVNDGMISGLFPSYTVVSGERFIAKIGFLAKGGTCGNGNVVFRLRYKESGAFQTLGSWDDACDSELIELNVNLNGIAGHSVQFELSVFANGAAKDDWAVWVNPRIQIP